jgi:hypothetical protein
MFLVFQIDCQTPSDWELGPDYRHAFTRGRNVPLEQFVSNRNKNITSVNGYLTLAPIRRAALTNASMSVPSLIPSWQ